MHVYKAKTQESENPGWTKGKLYFGLYSLLIEFKIFYEVLVGEVEYWYSDDSFIEITLRSNICITESAPVAVDPSKKQASEITASHVCIGGSI